MGQAGLGQSTAQTPCPREQPGKGGAGAKGHFPPVTPLQRGHGTANGRAAPLLEHALNHTALTLHGAALK